jgi:hypothetical protein
MAKTVYVFNCITQDVQIKINRGQDITVPKATYDGTKFTPGSSAASNLVRVSELTPTGKFGWENALHTRSEDVDEDYAIKIDKNAYPVDFDFELYLFHTGAILSLNGQVIWQTFYSPQPGFKLHPYAAR